MQNTDAGAREPSPLTLPTNRNFGLVFAAFFLLVAGVPVLHGASFRLWAFAVAGIFLLAALLVPVILAPFNLLWTRFGAVMHGIVSPVALGIIFFLVITPMGWLMRVLGKDGLRLQADDGAKSYWIDRQPPGPAPDSLKQPF